MVRRLQKGSFFILMAVLFFVPGVFAQEEAALRDVKPPIAIPMNIPGFLFWLFIIALLITGAAVFFMLKRSRIKKQEVEPVDPPWVTAYRHIEQLRKDQLIKQGKVKEYFTRLSDIVRRYLEGRFAIRAPEMTTEEFLRELKGSACLGERQKEFLRNFLNSCDMIKFARHSSSGSEMEKVLTAAVSLIDETKAPAGIEPQTKVLEPL